MLRVPRLSAAFALVVAAAVMSGGLGGGAVASPFAEQSREAAPGATRAQHGAAIAASASQVEEGDRFTLTVTVKAASRAARVTLQKYQPSLYGWDAPEWNKIKTVSVGGRRQLRFPVVATGINDERYRAVVAYRKAKRVTTKPVSVIVWRWIPLSEYRPYYQSESSAIEFGSFTINGHSYAGWGAMYYSHTGAWEARFTPGRHCREFRGVLGVADISHDESSATIALTADDTVVYESSALTPGMDVSINVPLASPYRFGVQLFDTTAGGTPGRDAIESWPAIGDPAFLCTGV